jgi:hypothetical protein
MVILQYLKVHAYENEFGTPTDLWRMEFNISVIFPALVPAGCHSGD